MKASQITIGDEILIGQVIDSNSSRIASWITPLGIKILKKWTVADEAAEIRYALQQACEFSQLIFITGGLGPTRDDITKKSIADFMSVPIIFSEQNKEHLESMLLPRGMKVTEAHLYQCYIPVNAELLDNQMGTALGMWIPWRDKIIICMPGVPYEMEYIMMNEVIPRLEKLTLDKKIAHKTFHVAGMGETDIAAIIEPLVNGMPEHISIAYLPSLAQVKVRFTSNFHSDHEKSTITQELDHYIQIAATALGTAVFGWGDTNLEKELGKLLIKHHLNLSTAESCTGGTIAHKITSVPGSSQYYRGGIIPYAVDIKVRLLEVAEETINKYNVVSEETAIEMVKGACLKFESQIAIATTGIAGPDGGSEAIPVGTIYLAVGNMHRVKTRKIKMTRDRIRNIEAASILALILAREWILDQYK
ncbi:MAG: CinA family nicotinamide mononucleotide deamidase-related protein [Bacteroidota bacterium]|nr:CinA family nicotinamide mononucleotide deamidase-related protein [Bacteroidota bacterium]